MQHPDRQDPTLAALQRAAASDDTIEWEELPSMADSLRERLVMLGQHHDPRRRSGLGPAAASAWAETLPVDLDALTALPVFHESSNHQCLFSMAARATRYWAARPKSARLLS